MACQMYFGSVYSLEGVLGPFDLSPQELLLHPEQIKGEDLEEYICRAVGWLSMHFFSKHYRWDTSFSF